MNIYYYLFYKFTKGLNKKNKNEWGPIAAITFFPYVNFIVIYLSFFPGTNENINNGSKIFIITVGVILFIINSILFLNKNRYKKIMERYKRESKKNKSVSSFLVALYILITLLSIFIV